MVILSENPYSMDVTRLDELRVEQLLLSGRPYEKVSGNAVMQIIRGMRK